MSLLISKLSDFIRPSTFNILYGEIKYIHNIYTIHFYIFSVRFRSPEVANYKLLCVLPLPEPYSEPNQTSETELYTESC